MDSCYHSKEERFHLVITLYRAGCALRRRVLSHLRWFLCWLNVVGSPWGCVQQFVSPSTHKKTFSASPILNMCSYSLLLPVMTLIHVLYCDLVLKAEFNILVGADIHIV